jgi:hypothetical protein
VIAWLGSVPSTDLFVSVIALGEIRKGIAKKRAVSPGDAARLEAWLTTLVLHYRSRVLPFDQDCADQWGGSWRFIRGWLSKMANSSLRQCSTISPSQPAMFGILSKLASLLSIRFDSPPSSLPKTVTSPVGRADESSSNASAACRSEGSGAFCGAS